MSGAELGAPAIKPLAESGLLVELGEAIDPATTARVMALTAALDAAALPGVLDVVPSYTTVLVAFDPVVADGDTLAAEIRRRCADLGAAAAAPAREVEIPVAYGGEFGPDLADVAAHVGLASDEVVARHAAGEYVVACMGFAPGFAFLAGLPPELAVPRLAQPRTRVPAGSVGIGGAQTGVYPMATPGGWRLIGRTPLRLFDLGRAEPFLLRPGDRVRFAPVSAARFRDLERAPAPVLHPEDRPPAGEGERGMVDRPSIVVVEPGLLTTVQDLGRPGLMRFGVSPGGALDRAALVLGNRLVGNEPGAAALEVTLVGPRLRFTAPAVVAITGADLGARRGGEALPRWEPVALAAGDEVAFTPTRGGGARAYLCLAGGLAVPPVMGSRSTDLFGGFGGWEGRALRAGDELPVGEPAAPRENLLRRRLAAPPPRSERDAPTRVVLGPQTERFTADGMRTFLGSDFAVSASSDRMGMRLTGPPVAHARGADLISEGIAHGAVQVPGDGQPIVLLAARQTVGGYPKIATAIGADLDALGQRLPGDPVRFAAVEPAEAHALTLAYHARLDEDAVTTAPRAWPGWSPGGTVAGPPGGTPDAWSAEDVAQLVPALREAGVDSLRVEYDDGAVRFRLELHRDAEGGFSPVDE